MTRPLKTAFLSVFACALTAQAQHQDLWLSSAGGVLQVAGSNDNSNDAITPPGPAAAIQTAQPLDNSTVFVVLYNQVLQPVSQCRIPTAGTTIQIGTGNPFTVAIGGPGTPVSVTANASGVTFSKTDMFPSPLDQLVGWSAAGFQDTANSPFTIASTTACINSDGSTGSAQGALSGNFLRITTENVLNMTDEGRLGGGSDSGDPPIPILGDPNSTGPRFAGNNGAAPVYTMRLFAPGGKSFSCSGNTATLTGVRAITGFEALSPVKIIWEPWLSLRGGWKIATDPAGLEIRPKRRGIKITAASGSMLACSPDPAKATEVDVSFPSSPPERFVVEWNRQYIAIPCLNRKLKRSCEVRLTINRRLPASASK